MAILGVLPSQAVTTWTAESAEADDHSPVDVWAGRQQQVGFFPRDKSLPVILHGRLGPNLGKRIARDQLAFHGRLEELPCELQPLGHGGRGKVRLEQEQLEILGRRLVDRAEVALPAEYSKKFRVTCDQTSFVAGFTSTRRLTYSVRKPAHSCQRVRLALGTSPARQN